jgi:catechol 2,3-dioxygenase-like lactoylglutathione lyase family enzyme
MALPGTRRQALIECFLKTVLEQGIRLMSIRTWPLMVVFAAATAGLLANRPDTNNVRIGNNPTDPDRLPKLVNTCLITPNVKRLVDFYELILMRKAERSGPDYAEFPAGAGVLAIFSAETQEKYIPGSAEAAKNKSVILEFRVANVDGEYRRLQSLVKTWVKPPTTQQWGTRSVYFRDPDGNLVDFYMPAKAE